jgi:MoaA/NifB/PqqE/SkfB family radical SAM enzyme
MKIYKKARLLYSWAFTNTKTTAAIDITNICNLKCSHCYWWKEECPAELGDNSMVAFMKGLRAMGMTAHLRRRAYAAPQDVRGCLQDF